MKTQLRQMMLLLFLLLVFSCGSDVEMDSNLPEPPPPGQTPPPPQDADNDGVADADDQCPETPASENADENGCSTSQKDSDDDGVSDADDQCPETPAGATVDENGCEEGNDDGDGDGVPNDDDQCPNTPEGEEVDENGCSDSQNTADADGDGVPDADDDCPNTPEGEEVDENGCSDSQNTADADGDGVKDDIDQCPDTPEGENVDDEGCSDSQKDDDDDGVSNAEDQCPDTEVGASVNEEGCSDAQSDTSPPVVTNIVVDQITPTTFRVEWNLDEGSKGYIRFGTSSGNYQDSTAKEERFLDRHRQTVGGENPAPLTPNTTYYWQIYVEDETGNKGYWEEQTTKTAEEAQASKTFVPDDVFEQFLIEQGYDDILDNYVLTENIENITELNITNQFDTNGRTIDDWTGIQDFSSLEKLRIDDDNQYGIISTLDALETAPALKELRLWATAVPLIVNNFPKLEVFSYGAFGDYTIATDIIEIMDNPNLQELYINSISISNEGATGNIRIENNPVLEKITEYGTFSNIFEINNNPLLTSLSLGYYEEITGINTLSVNNNPSLEMLNLIQCHVRENISISNSPDVKIITATGDSSQSAIYKIALSQFEGLEELYLMGVTSVNISANKTLNTLNISEFNGINLSKLDVSNNNALSNLKINGHELNCIKVNQSQLDNIPSTWEVTPTVPYTLDCN
ncbi:hypothetical protein E7Z59_08855 [Robertkochia marina]|uniref:Fibronectin type-III domain-containing protein n=1 Tax=Robertkochia marina TaxID=1227945 RepID=A0A4S3M032_9FLAO|nr:fibronectin type III domain-containing protein [Robertkochia marina]THD67752.1 hypothetical protein E7Z59_08855 [Robertkochia marina]TRZ40965.1 hypothetical protein D3A96_14540 [Robertkochia marina]